MANGGLSIIWSPALGRRVVEARDAIAARRRLTNKLIAAHDADRLRPFLDPAINLIAGDGALIIGVEAVIAAYRDQFRDADFVTYVRTTDQITLDQDAARAAETGRWRATTRSAPELSGPYLAVWRKVRGQWLIQSELFVTLAAG